MERSVESYCTSVNFMPGFLESSSRYLAVTVPRCTPIFLPVVSICSRVALLSPFTTSTWVTW